MSKRRIASISSSFLQYFVFLFLFSGLSEAAVFNCTSVGGVSCLIDAIVAANDETNSPGPDTINLDGSTFTLDSVNNFTDGSNGLPSVVSEIVINGNGSTIERSSVGGTPEFRIFHVSSPDGNLVLNNLVITGGFSNDEDGGGGVLNWGMLTINESEVSDNRTADGGTGAVDAPKSGGAGGGISNRSTGELIISNSTIANNETGKGAENTGNLNNGDGGLGGQGGGILNIGLLDITTSTVSGNFTGNGGDGSINGGSGGVGAGIGNYGTMTMANTTVSGNSTGGGGVGINNIGGGGGNGGGVHNGGVGSIVNSTVTDNSVGIGGNGTSLFGPVGNGSGVDAFGGDLTISNSIVAHNVTSVFTDNCLGAITNGGANLSDDASCGFGAGDSISDINLDPSLADNGGSTETHALFVLGGSAAIDAGDNAICSNSPVNGVDQRNFPRDANCDIGAYEVVLAGAIKIIKLTNPAGETDFEFVGTGFPAGCDLNAFTLDDKSSKLCLLGAGIYTVQEVNLPAGWSVTNIDCVGSSSFSVNMNTVTINFVAGEAVVCGFTNVLVQPSQALDSLVEEVEELGLPEGIENSLLKKLDNANRSIEKSRNNAAMNKLNALINHLEDLNDNEIVADEDADRLIGLAHSIINAL